MTIAPETAPAALAHIAAPADADHVEDWVDWNDTGEYERYMRGTRRTVAGVEIRIVGWQQADGTVTRHASVWATDTQLDAAALRQLAALALDTADELDRFEAIAQCTVCDRDGMVYDFEGDWLCFHEHDDEQEKLA
jgi:hypothetical protein